MYVYFLSSKKKENEIFLKNYRIFSSFRVKKYARSVLNHMKITLLEIIGVRVLLIYLMKYDDKQRIRKRILLGSSYEILLKFVRQ